MSDRRTLETGSEDLLATVEDRVAVLTMNRPARRNALSDAMLEALETALDALDRDGDVGCIVLTGAGGAFCAGGDVKAMNEANSAEPSGERPPIDHAIHRQRLSQRATAGRLYSMSTPTIASLPGAAAGAGLSLALACDLRIASEDAILTTAFAKVGFSGDYGGTFFMTKLIGAAKARELYLLSDRVDALQAERLGLVNRVVPADALEKETHALAHRIAHGPSIAYAYMKENINRALEGGEMGDCLDLEATHHVHTAFTKDHRNAVRAFVEKRTPVFEGR
ncbi:MAG: enoyl-CoA hydratase [bacterium]|nr:enoyl-CoA hydratase [bacterium]